MPNSVHVFQRMSRSSLDNVTVAFRLATLPMKNILRYLTENQK